VADEEGWRDGGTAGVVGDALTKVYKSTEQRNRGEVEKVKRRRKR
jgi:hypothetical protein